MALNTGNGYDSETGIFTAPVAGTYAFFLTQMGVDARGTVALAIVKHGDVLDLVYSKDHEDQGSGQVTAHLGSGQQVWVRHVSGNAVRGSWYTVFTGYLIHAEWLEEEKEKRKGRKKEKKKERKARKKRTKRRKKEKEKKKEKRLGFSFCAKHKERERESK